MSKRLNSRRRVSSHWTEHADQATRICRSLTTLLPPSRLRYKTPIKVGIPPHYSYLQIAIIPSKNFESSVEISPQQTHRTKNRNQLVYKRLRC